MSDNISGIAPGLLKRLRNILRSCPQMKKNETLRTIFVDSRIVSWAQELPQADDEASRVDSLIAHLCGRLDPNDEYALVLFLYVLADYNDNDVRLCYELREIAGELSDSFNPLPQQLSCDLGSVSRNFLHPPPPPDPFINQIEELNTLAENLSAYRDRGGVFILVGQPGVGKTALAAQLSKKLAPNFGRVLWIPLESNHSVDTIWVKIVRTFETSFPDDQALDVYTHVCKVLRDNRPLLVIDHAESSLDLVADILDNCGRITTVLVLSSNLEVMDNDNVAVLELDPLPCEEAVNFVKARLRIPVFKIEEFENTIEILCKRLGNLPLALEIAAGYISMNRLTPQEYADRYLEASLKKEKRLEKCFITSYVRLTKEAQLALVVMALDNGESVAPEAVVAGMGSQMTDECVTQACFELIRYSLIDRKESSRLRYVLHPVVRYYAREQLRDLHIEIKMRLLDYYLNYVEDHSAPTIEDYDSLEAEHTSLLLSMQNAYLTELWETVRRFAHVLCRSADGYLYVRGYWGEMQDRLKEAIHAAEIENQNREATIFRCDLAALHYLTGEREVARLEYEAALATFEKEESPDEVTITEVAKVKHRLGLIEQNAGNYEQAICYYQQSLRIYECFDSEIKNQAMLLHQLGRVAQDKEQYAEAHQYYDQSLRIKHDVDDESGIADTLHQLGQLSKIEGDFEKARAYYEDCCRFAEKYDDRARMAEALGEMGRLMHDIGDYAKACSDYIKSLDISEQLGVVKTASIVRDNLLILIQDLENSANLVKSKGGKEQAEYLYLQALAISRRLGNVIAERKTLFYLAEVYAMQGRRDEVHSLWKRAAEITEQVGLLTQGSTKV